MAVGGAGSPCQRESSFDKDSFAEVKSATSTIAGGFATQPIKEDRSFPYSFDIAVALAATVVEVMGPPLKVVVFDSNCSKCSKALETSSTG